MSEADLPVALEAARAGAAEVASGVDRRVEVRYKADADPVTEVDHRSESAILDVISRRRPRDPVLGEERGGRLPEDGRVWLVDPLDGTTNFVHGFPWVSVSVALWIDNAPAVGVVLDVITGDEYTAVTGGGARANGSPIAVSSVEDFGEALVVTGFPYEWRERIEVCDTRFRRVLGTAQGVRRLGAASLDMCMVARGRMDGYWEEDLPPWDMGAGTLLVTEAGGTVSDRSGRPVGPSGGFVVASNGRIHHQFLDTLGEPGLTERLP
ncbi:MAG: inositol monophosphatase [Acidimicrobiia bacterium]|nr:inositol monophosphatase [Acidimicrobiia bacterium]MYF83851.1 inositol monophosphatase [Acidimicrobiia bacterium]